MKINFKGIYTKDTKLRAADFVEEKIHKIEEPISIKEKHKKAYLFSLVVFFLIVLACQIKLYLNGYLNIEFDSIGVLLFFILIPAHELLHSIVFEDDAIIDLYINPKNLSVFITTTNALERKRYILMLLFPNICLGFLPLLYWVVLPGDLPTLFTFAILELFSGVSDYYQVYLILTQSIKHSIIQSSNDFTYWFLEKNERITN